ncbi:hypothetical protein DZB84_06335 [Bacillus sp. HNG]|nr:hypothetical protein DZB84_06335 [Bacillus sp. HNG]
MGHRDRFLVPNKMTEVKKMAKQKKNNKRNSEVGSGSRYHEEHASHVPDYGANSMDPNAKNAK